MQALRCLPSQTQPYTPLELQWFPSNTVLSKGCAPFFRQACQPRNVPHPFFSTSTLEAEAQHFTDC